jgi:hypothetical protein
MSGIIIFKSTIFLEDGKKLWDGIMIAGRPDSEPYRLHQAIQAAITQ